MAAINTNLVALTVQAHQGKAQTSLSVALERLSSGLRVNGAKDDAAGLGIANRMEANLRADSQISRGINDGISLIQTAEGGLNSINDLLQRSRELAVQAANGTLSDTDRAAINREYHALRDEIDRIATGTEAFGKHLLAPVESPAPPPETQLGNTRNIKETFPTSGSSITAAESSVVPMGLIPEGAKNVTIIINSFRHDDDMQIFTRDGKHLIGTQVEGAGNGDEGDIVWRKNRVFSGEDVTAKVFTEENGFLAKAEYSDEALLNNTRYDPNGGETKHYKGMELTFSGDGDHFDGHPGDGRTILPTERLHIDETTEPLFLVVAGNGFFDATVEWEHMPDTVTPVREQPPARSGIDIVVGANYGNEVSKVTIEFTPADSTSLGLDSVELDPAEEAMAALAKLDTALAKVDEYRGRYGALQNRFEGAIENLGQQQINTAAARSRIMDADYAQEVANMTRAQILQQASHSLLAQANQVPRSVLTLLGQ